METLSQVVKLFGKKAIPLGENSNYKGLDGGRSLACMRNRKKASIATEE